MAQQLSETATNGEEGDANFNFDQWLIKYELTDIKQVLVDHNMNTLSSLNLNNVNFVKVMSDQRVVVHTHLIPKIIAAIQSLESIRNSQDQKQKTKSKLVFVSTKENEMLSQIKQYLVDIKNLNDELKNIESKYHNKKQQNLKIIQKNKDDKLNKINDEITKVFGGLHKILYQKEKELKNKIIEYKMKTNTDDNKTDELDGLLQNTCIMVNDDEKYLQEKMDSCKEVYNNDNDDFDFHTETEDRRNKIVNIGNETKEYFDERMQEINNNKQEIIKYIENDLESKDNELMVLPTLNVNSAIYNDICQDINSFVDVQSIQNAQNKMKSKSEQIELLKAQMTDNQRPLNDKIMSKQQQIDSVNNKLNAEISRCNEYNAQLSDMSKEKEKLNAMVKSLNDKIFAKQQQIDSIDKKLNDETNRSNEYNSQLSEISKKNEKLNERVKSLNDQISVKQQQIDCIDKKLNDERHRSNEYSSHLSEITIKNEQLNQKMVCLNNKLKQKDEQIEKKETEHKHDNNVPIDDSKNEMEKKYDNEDVKEEKKEAPKDNVLCNLYKMYYKQNGAKASTVQQLFNYSKANNIVVKYKEVSDFMKYEQNYLNSLIVDVSDVIIPVLNISKTISINVQSGFSDFYCIKDLKATSTIEDICDKLASRVQESTTKINLYKGNELLSRFQTITQIGLKNGDSLSLGIHDTSTGKDSFVQPTFTKFHMDELMEIVEATGTDGLILVDNSDNSDNSDDSDEFVNVVVCINSEAILAGYAGDDEPQIVIPCVVGNHREDIILGLDVQKKGGSVKHVRNPIENAEIVDYDAIEKILGKILINMDEENIRLMITECTLAAKSDREKLISIAFEELDCSGYYTITRNLCSLYYNGRTTGVVLYSDYHGTEVAPIFEGYVLPHGVIKTNLGNKDILEYLKKKQNDEDNKEDDGMELLFNPKLCVSVDKHKYDGIHQLIYQSIMKTDVDIRKDLFSNIILAGINTIFDGLKDRLEQEIKTLAPDTMTIKIIAPPETAQSAWVGGSILGSLSTFEEMWVTKEQYDESGASIVHRKCC